MWDMNDIRSATHVGDHVISVRFDDGTTGQIDLSCYVNRGPIFRPFADIDYFRRFTIEGGTLTWPNGADIAPERLYEMVMAANKRLHATP